MNAIKIDFRPFLFLKMPFGRPQESVPLPAVASGHGHG